MPTAPTDPAALLQAQDLAFSYPGLKLLERLSFIVRPGLTLVRGGDGRGKRTLLRLMAGTLQPDAGTLHRQTAAVFLENLADPVHDPLVASAWLDARRRRHHPGWDTALAAGLIDAFGLAEHIDKPLYMLSTGSRRKVGLVAAAASGALLTLVDRPFAALDASACRVLAGLLRDAAEGDRRAWVMADHGLPDGLEGVRLSGLIDLGD